MTSDIRKGGFFDRLKSGLAKTRGFFLKNVDDIILGEKTIGQDLYDELEEMLVAADLGPAFTHQLLDIIKEQVKRKELDRPEFLRTVLKQTMLDILRQNERTFQIPAGQIFSILVVGVNGTGKTTTIGKLAHQIKQQGRTVMLVAADTFRAAAIEQIEVWGRRVGAPVIRQQPNADPSAVVFDAIHSARAGKADVMLVDTAGRLHTKVNLMEELKKVRRIMARELPGAPNETFLVLDATTGQNAIIQAKMFHEEIGITGLVLTKLDGTAKGGVVIRIAKELGIPIRFIGVGEGLEDLRPFDGGEFVEALFQND